MIAAPPRAPAPRAAGACRVFRAPVFPPCHEWPRCFARVATAPTRPPVPALAPASARTPNTVGVPDAARRRRQARWPRRAPRVPRRPASCRYLRALGHAHHRAARARIGRDFDVTRTHRLADEAQARRWLIRRPD